MCHNVQQWTTGVPDLRLLGLLWNTKASRVSHSMPDDGNAKETIIEDFQRPDVAREDYPEEGAAMKPCSIGALGAAASGGFIGALYGAGETSSPPHYPFMKSILDEELTAGS